MDGNGSTRVDLGEGQWIELRTRTTVGDLEHTELKRMERGGKTTPTLALIDTLERVITGWSFEQEISPATIRDVLEPNSLIAISEATRGERPNKSASSSNGGARRGRKAAN